MRTGADSWLQGQAKSLFALAATESDPMNNRPIQPTDNRHHAELSPPDQSVEADGFHLGMRNDSDEDAPPARLQAGQSLSQRYKLVQTLGRGGTGEVWLADDGYTRQRVAL